MRFSHKINFSMVGALTVGLALISGVFYSTTSHILENNLKSNATNRAIYLIETLDRFMLQRSRDINVVSTSIPFKSAHMDLKAVQKRLEDYIQDWRIYSSFSFYNTDGRCLVDTAGFFVGTSAKDRLFFEGAMKNGDSIGTELSISPPSQEPTIYFSSTVLGAENTVIGVIVGRVPVALLQEIMSEGESFQLDLINRDHHIIFTTRNAGQGAIEFNAPLFDGELLAELDSGKRVGFSKKHWLKEIGAHFAAFATESGHREFQGNQWTVVLWIPDTYITTPLNKLKSSVGTSFLLAIFISVLLASYLGRQLSRPLRRIAAAALELGQGNLDVKLEHKAEDEFGELASTFTTMSANLKAAQDQMSGYSAQLEKQVRDRTVKLEESTKQATDLQEITLSILEDTNEAKAELADANTSLKKAQTEISEFASNLEDKVNTRTKELEVLYDISNLVSYTNDYQALSLLIMESLSQIVQYDICALLLFDAQSAIFGMKITYAPAEKFADEIRATLTESVQTLTGESIHTKKLSSKLISPSSTGAPDGRTFTKIRSSLDLPLIVSGKTIGAISITSCEENAFPEESTRLIRTITNHISSTLARLHTTLAAEKTKMEFMVESMSEGIIMTDENDAIIVFNPRAREFIGVSTHEHVPDSKLIDKMQSLGLTTLLQTCKSEKKPATQTIITQSSGRDMFIKCDASPVYTPDSATIGYVTILRDITKERELDRIKTEFVSTVSHELRTPLSITKEGISLVLDKTVGDLNERQSLFLTAAKNNIDRLTNIINDLLDIAKIDDGKMSLILEPTDFSELLRQVADTFQIRARRKGIDIRTKLPAEGLIVSVDRDKMTQILVNLIDNAMKFTDKGHIEVSAEDLGTEVKCTIEDAGVGISMENLKNLFKKFQQFNRVESEEKGTGLGLSIVKGLIELHRGKVWAESELGVGTKFYISFPKR